MSIPISNWWIPLTLAAILGCWAPWRSPSAEAASPPCDAFDDMQGLCRCTLQEKTPTNDSHNQVWVTCINVTSLEHLSLVLSPMRGRRIDKFQLGLSTVGYVPSNLFLDIAVQDLQFWDSPLSTFVLGDERAFLGLESTLRWLSMRRCRLNSSLPFQRWYRQRRYQRMVGPHREGQQEKLRLHLALVILRRRRERRLEDDVWDDLKDNFKDDALRTTSRTTSEYRLTTLDFKA
ncbi:nyctalopin [Ixodes scapularis]